MKCRQISDWGREAGSGFNTIVCLFLFSLDTFSQQLKEGLSVERRLKHRHAVWFCCDGLICCLFTGHTGLPWQADRGIDPRAQLKPETGNDLSSTLSSLTMANGLRGLFPKVSWHQKNDVCSQSVQVTHGGRTQSLPKTQKLSGSWGRSVWQTTKHSLQTHTEHISALPRRMSASNEWISTSPGRLPAK